MHRSDTSAALERAMTNASLDLDFIQVDTEAFAVCLEDFIDAEVMRKKTKGAIVVQIGTGRNDIGIWASFRDQVKKD